MAPASIGASGVWKTLKATVLIAVILFGGL